MKRLHFANILLLCALGTLLFWPKITNQVVHESVEASYASICVVTTNGFTASGVLLESGYVLTAAHVVDLNADGEIDADEKFIMLNFPLIGFKTKAEVLTSGFSKNNLDLDLAILKPEGKVPLKGVKLISEEEYWALKIGTPIYTIGFQQGVIPANITDGRVISLEQDKFIHRNSANSYYGNSGGGVFIGNKLVGIAVAVGIGRFTMNVPIIDVNRRMQVGVTQVPYTVPLSNSSCHMSIPSIHILAENAGLEETLISIPVKHPYREWYAVIGFNFAVFLWLILIFKLMRQWMK